MTKRPAATLAFALAPVIIAQAALAAFFLALKNDFVLFDDDDYITNAVVPNGLTWAGLRWAFTTGHAANYHPLTWLSHMLDVTLFGLNHAGHHLTSLVLHLLNSVLLYWALWRLTGAYRRAAVVALLFAVHPLHTESVAWVSERKDLLCAFFTLIALIVYARYARKRTAGAYGALVGAFLLALLSKPMAVTLPLLLLLLDYWPLFRLSDPALGDTLPLRARALLWEKLPLAALSAGMSVVTFFVQRSGGAMHSAAFPLLLRLENAAVSYVMYLWKLFWPAKLSAIYPHPGAALSLFTVAASVALLVVITLVAWRARRQAPYLLVGWLWFAVMLVPVSGIVQVGYAAMADRYMYLPMAGVLVALAWGVGALLGPDSHRRQAIALPVFALTLGTCMALMYQSQRQTEVWRDSVTLFTHATTVTERNAAAYAHLGVAYLKVNEPAKAVTALSSAVEIEPKMKEAWTSLGVAYRMTGDLQRSIASHREAIRLAPDDPEIRINLAMSCLQAGDYPEAEKHLREAIRLAPESEPAHRNLARLLQWIGKTDESEKHRAEADRLLQRRPGAISKQTKDSVMR